MKSHNLAEGSTVYTITISITNMFLLDFYKDSLKFA